MQRQGNLLLASLLVPESQWHWISRTDWPQVETLASDYVRNNPAKTLFIPEGACMVEALPGSLTLALDLLQNEEEQPFHHIFMDAGTGLTAIATILAFAWLKKRTLLHVLLLADTEEQFLVRLERFRKSFEQFIEEPVDPADLQFQLHLPTQARAFGSVNKAVIDHVKFLAREEGFFTDPIYSAKLFWESHKIMKEQSLTGNILVIHSGGALTLMGFQDQLKT